MKHQKRSYSNPVTALIMGFSINKNSPILLRDKDGDISSRLSDENMVNDNLRNPILDIDYSEFEKSKEIKLECKVAKANHKKFGKLLNHDAVKEGILKQIGNSLNNKYLRMNINFIVTGYMK